MQVKEWAERFTLDHLVAAGKRGQQRATARHKKHDGIYVARAMRRQKLHQNDGDAEYVIEEVKSQREIDGGIEYLVEWEGYGSDWDTWEPEAELHTDNGEPVDALEMYMKYDECT